MSDVTVTFPIEDVETYTKAQLVSIVKDLADVKFESYEDFVEYVTKHKFGKPELANNNKDALLVMANEFANLDTALKPQDMDSQPRVEIKLSHEVIANELGVRDHILTKDMPVVVDQRGNLSIVRMQPTEVVERAAQPVLTEKEALALGVVEWHRFTRDPKYFTTVVNSRRFLLEEPVFQKLKGRGQVREVGPKRHG